MNKQRIRQIVIIVMFLFIVFYTLPLLVAKVNPTLDKNTRVGNSQLPWEYLYNSLFNKDKMDRGVRFWSGQRIKLGLDLQGGMQFNTVIDTTAIKEHLSDAEKAKAVDSGLEILRNRIDEFGVAEPILQKTGNSGIFIQLPGVKEDFARPRKIIESTALLEFKIVAENETAASAARKMDEYLELHKAKYLDKFKGLRVYEEKADSSIAGKSHIFSTLIGVDPSAEGGAPNPMPIDRARFALVDSLLSDPEIRLNTLAGYEYHVGKADKKDPSVPRSLYLLYEKADLTGDYLKDVKVDIGNSSDPKEAGQSFVLLDFNADGVEKFATLTGANVKKNLAVVLDSVVYIAPQITEKIRGSARITGLTDDEANDVSVILNAGKLPAPFKIIEERIVGPSLGSDSIRAGIFSALLGFLLVVLFMFIYYGFSGLIADIAVLVNIGFVLAAMTMFEATLTLPGIAAFVLTIGMSVDANVLIYERIREEIATGKTIRSAVEAGFSRAFITILDSNVTTLLTALVLYQFGTGPIRGFAVTLSIGIIGSMLTAIVLVKWIFDNFITNVNREKLSV
jgi:protein-export membrane protein SecD